MLTDELIILLDRLSERDANNAAWHLAEKFGWAMLLGTRETAMGYIDMKMRFSGEKYDFTSEVVWEYMKREGLWSRAVEGADDAFYETCTEIVGDAVEAVKRGHHKG